MASMLALLAPQEPHVYVMVQVFLLHSTVLVELLVLKVLHGIEDGDRLETDGAGREIIMAELALNVFQACLRFIKFFVRN